MNSPDLGFEVFVFKGSRFLGSRCFSQASIVIGRGREAALKLQDPQVAEQHAILRLEGEDLILADRGGHGVFLNGNRVSVSRISANDEVSIGPFRLKIAMLGQEDQGFGAESAPEPQEDATLPRASLQGQPVSQDPYPALEPQASYDAYQSEEEFDEMETRVGRVQIPTEDPAHEKFSAKDSLPGRSGGEEQNYFEDFPAKETPSPSHEDGVSDYERSAPTRRSAPSPATSQQGQGSKRAKKKKNKKSKTAPLSALASTDRQASVPERVSKEALAQPAPRAYFPDDDDDDDEEENWVEPFSLLENIVRERFKSRVPATLDSIVEAIHYNGTQVIDLLHADPGENITVGHDDFHLLNLESDDRAFLYFQKDFSGTLVSKGKARPLKAFCNSKYLVEGFKNLYAVVLQEGDYAQVLRRNQGYLVRFVRPPVLPEAKFRFKMRLDTVQVFAASIACHLLLMTLMAAFATEDSLVVEGDSERFAKVALKDLNLEKAIEEPKVETPKDETKPAPPPKDVPKPTKQPRVVRRKVKTPRVNTPGPSVAKQARVQKKQVANVLSALENLKPAGKSAGRSDLKALASNISAVRVRGGASSGFKVSGVIGKIAGGGVRLSGGLGGGGGKDTKVGSQLLAGGSVGKISALKGTGTRVRGRVRKAPTRAIRATGGHLDRAAIQRVVSQHMHQVQACYERQLLTNPGLSGKIVFDWVISTSGSVSSARQVRSSMRTPAVSSCILKLIRSWRFPRPVGGSVQVRYPFVFRVQGF